MNNTMESLAQIDLDAYMALVAGFVQKVFLSPDGVIQIATVVAALVLGYMLSLLPQRRLEKVEARTRQLWLQMPLAALEAVLAPVFAFILLQVYPPAASALGLKQGLVGLAGTLLGAWIVIRFFSAFMHYKVLARWLAVLVFAVAALHELELLAPLLNQLDSIGFSFGETRITLLTLAKAVLVFAVVFWLSRMISRVSERRIQQMSQLTPSLRVLIIKIVRVGIIVIAFVVALNMVGIDLTSLAVFSGAIGLGLGFGLQKVVSNFISGIILLLDRSIKPGDVIAVDQTYGWVNKLSARHVSVITRDGKEHLIPNELLITERVENWSYSDRNIRLKIPVGISYDGDPRLALKLMLEAAAETPRILKTPKPNALLVSFGDSSVDLELRAWIDDPVNGIGNIRSALLLNIWDKFKEHGVEIPFPQRDIHIKSGKITS